MAHPDFTIVAGHLSGMPLILLPNGYAYLRTDHPETDSKDAGKIIPYRNHMSTRLLDAYTGTLTDEEEALAMRLMLVGANDASA